MNRKHRKFCMSCFPVDCQWEPWSTTPTKVDPADCGDGMQPRRRVGEVTRKHKPYSNGNIKGPGGECKGDPNPNNPDQPYETKKPWYEDCPGEFTIR